MPPSVDEVALIPVRRASTGAGGQPVTLGIYAAILGKSPAVDPSAPGLLPGSEDTTSGQRWRREAARLLHLEETQHARSWRGLLGDVADVASQRLHEARRRLKHVRKAA